MSNAQPPRPRNRHLFSAVVMTLGLLASCGDLTCIELTGCDLGTVLGELQADEPPAAPTADSAERSAWDHLLMVEE